MDAFRPSARPYADQASEFMRRVYLWMGAGLLITAACAAGTAALPQFRAAVFGSYRIVILLILAHFGLVVVLTTAIHRLTETEAAGCFALYAALTGVMLSSVFLRYPLGDIANAFVTAAGMFTAMSIYGTVTRRDLTDWGSFLFMGVVGLLVAAIVNFFLHSSRMSFAVSCCGVVVFTGLAAYNTWRLWNFGQRAPYGEQSAIRGALSLYLDLVNLFRFLLRLMGERRG